VVVRNCAAVQSRPFNIAQILQDALSLHQQGRLRDAEKLYTRALKAAPDNFDALHLLGLIKAQNGQMGEAYRLMSAALRANSNVPDVLINFANVLHSLKRDEEALATIDKALALRPGDPDALLYRGNALNALNRPSEALPCFDAVLARNRGHRDALLNRGVAHAALGNHDQALADFDAVIARNPADVGGLFNRGTALIDLGRHADALIALDHALINAPQHLGAWTNRGRALQILNRHQEAIASFDKALAIDKNHGDSHFNAALSLLTLENFHRGFVEYEWRWKRTGMTDARRGYRGRLWLGEFPLERRTILLQAEQGLGDTIQFVRYASLLAQTGANVVLEVQPELKGLLSTVSGVASCYARGETLPSFDVYCPLGSLPLALKTEPSSVPTAVPYLHADEAQIAKWRPAIEALSGKRVALAWAGHARHANDRNRSIDLRLFEPLFACEGVSFVSIQRDLRGDDAARLAAFGITDFGPRLADMTDTAAVLALMDLSISVDTSVVHLAGAMGREAWVMLPFTPDWRWTLTNERSPWYPTMRLFRQRTSGDWPKVIATVRDALRS
jgi:tetratricopeptide (TPR) repeat protein